MRKGIWISLALLVCLSVLPALARGDLSAVVRQESLSQPRIYAYRGWQSVGVRADQGDRLIIHAQGTWLYTPGEYHGPEGHDRYTSPSFYPLPGVPGGALIGRVGEQSQPFYVGQGTSRITQNDGTVYLRIDDDILSDNDGYVTVDVTVEPTEEGRP